MSGVEGGMRRIGPDGTNKTDGSPTAQCVMRTSRDEDEKQQAVETVEVAVSECHTLLKQGVNERGKRFLNFEFRFLIDPCSRSVAARMRLRFGFAEALVFECSMIIFFMRAVYGGWWDIYGPTVKVRNDKKL